MTKTFPETLTFGTLNSTNSSAQVDIWHSDALGQYSGFSGNSTNATNDTFLRGYQRTDANGGVTQTIVRAVVVLSFKVLLLFGGD